MLMLNIEEDLLPETENSAHGAKRLLNSRVN